MTVKTGDRAKVTTGVEYLRPDYKNEGGFRQAVADGNRVLRPVKRAHPKRSFCKSITWRITATLTTVLLVYIFFHDVKTALSVGFVEIFVKMVVYYFHERAWNRTSWGLYEEN